METTKYIWLNGDLVLWENAKIHVITHSLHYGGGVFEGLRVYPTNKGPAIFRLPDHTNRLFYSAESLKLKIPFSKEVVNKAHIEVVKTNNLQHGYIRPIVYFGYGKMGLNPNGAPTDIAIACWPWGAYLPYESIDVKISSYMRIHPKSTVADAKITGHYVNSILAVQELEGTKYHESLLLDYNGNIAEGPGENFFMIKDKVIYTTPAGTILLGITRSTVLELAQKMGYKVVEKLITPQEAFMADEAFYTGSAAEITAINSIDDHVIGQGGVGEITQNIKQAYHDIVHGKNSDFIHYLTYIN